MAQLQQVPLIAPLNTNVNELVASNSHVSFWNWVYDDANNITTRPGHTLFTDLGTLAPVYGYWWQRAQVAICASAGNLYTLDRWGNASAPIATYIASIQPVYFCDDGDRLFLAAGGQIFLYTAADGITVISDPLAPTNTTTPIFHDGYILANEQGSNIVDFGEYDPPTAYPLEPYKWGSGRFFSAETNPDKVISLLSIWRQVIVFGETSIEPWANDGDTPFSRSGSVVLNHGIPCAGATTVADDIVYLFTSRREVIRMNNSQVDIITGGMAAEFNSLTTVNDCEASYFKTRGNKRLVCFSFPTDQVTFVWDIGASTWYRWGSWDLENQAFQAAPCSRYIYAQGWNKWLGFTRDGKILEISDLVATDVSDTIRSVVRTSFGDGGTPLGKIPIREILVLRRGTGIVDTQNPLNTNIAAVMTLRWRNDDEMTWHERSISLGKTGEYSQVETIRRSGIYKRRQYEIEYSAATPLTILAFYQDADVKVF